MKNRCLLAAADETEPVHHVAEQPAILTAADYVHGLQPLRSLGQCIDKLDDGALMRDGHDTAIRVVPAPLERDEIAELLRIHIDRDQHRVDAERRNMLVEHIGRTNLRNRMADDLADPGCSTDSHGALLQW